ncbi:hypothetical protein GCM10020218_104000 [Dactylosporangium vinaceum]
MSAQIGEAIGRSRGGLSTKPHLTVDGHGRPLSILLTPGQAGDNPQLPALLDHIAINPTEPGAPRKRPDLPIADKGYAHDSTRRALWQRSPAAPPRAATVGAHRPLGLRPRRVQAA